MIKPIQLGVVLFVLFPSITIAGTIIEVQNGNESTMIVTDGQQARMKISGDQFVIVDYKSHQVKMVNPAQKEIMLFDASQKSAGSNAPGVRTELKLLGAGGNIAGYPTQKFAYSANGKFCGVVYGSKSAYQIKDIKELFNAMKTMVDSQQAVLGGFAAMLDDCLLADMKMSDHVGTIGVPMRTEKNGQIETEIKNIKLNAVIPADTFALPATYKTVSLQGQMNALADQKPKLQETMQQYQPQMQQMMQQMQQSGQISPEAMQQMQRVQEMMQQQ